MTRLLFAMALALLGWVAATDRAAAVTIDPDPFAVFGNTAGPSTAINDAYEFTFTGTATGYFAVLAGGIGSLTTSICSDAACSTSPLFFGSTIGNALVSFSDASFNLTSGTYFLVISGLTIPIFGGGYFGVVTLNVAPVPLPPALLLFLTALGGIGVARYWRRGGLAEAA